MGTSDIIGLTFRQTPDLKAHDIRTGMKYTGYVGLHKEMFRLLFITFFNSTFII
jgi:hypothetical protein